MDIARQTFGKRGEELTLTIKAAGAESTARQLTFARGQLPMPPGSPSGSMLVPLMPLVDWRGRFIPCTAAGPTTPITYAVCEKLFRPWGYVKAKDAGSAGFTIDSARLDGAIIAAVERGSAAEKAGLKAGGVVTAVDRKPLSGSAGDLARTGLFGRTGDTRVLIVEREGKQTTTKLVLGK